MTPRFLHDDTCLLSNERGVTLLEVLVTAVVLALLVLSVYIGIVFAERMAVRNYRDRAATLIATGELERQYFINRYNAMGDQDYFKLFSNREVVIDRIGKRDLLMGSLTVSRYSGVEYSDSQRYSFNYLIARVEWRDPYNDEITYIQLREDYYKKLGS